jgi:hypothetical protein
MRWPVKHRQHRARLVLQEQGEVRHQALHQVHLARFVQQEVTLRHREVHLALRAQVAHLIRWLVKHRARYAPLEHMAQLPGPPQLQPALCPHRLGTQPESPKVVTVLPQLRCRLKGWFLSLAANQASDSPVLWTCTTRAQTRGRRLRQV